MDNLLHLWCSHCNQSLCGLTEADCDGPQIDNLGSGDEGLDCIVCSDLAWSSRRKARCLRVVAGD